LSKEKSIKLIEGTTNYLTAALVPFAIYPLYLLWGLFTGRSHDLLFVGFNLVVSLSLAGVLFWCIRLLKEQRVLSLWLYLGVVVATFCYLMIYRVVTGAPIFSPADIILYGFQALILYALYSLKKSGLLS